MTELKTSISPVSDHSLAIPPSCDDDQEGNRQRREFTNLAEMCARLKANLDSAISRIASLEATVIMTSTDMTTVKLQLLRPDDDTLITKATSAASSAATSAATSEATSEATSAAISAATSEATSAAASEAISAVTSEAISAVNSEATSWATSAATSTATSATTSEATSRANSEASTATTAAATASATSAATSTNMAIELLSNTPTQGECV